ncbi:hypothetical protein D3C72_728430 [compost metagenome]
MAVALATALDAMSASARPVTKGATIGVAAARLPELADRGWEEVPPVMSVSAGSQVRLPARSVRATWKVWTEPGTTSMPCVLKALVRVLLPASRVAMSLPSM